MDPIAIVISSIGLALLLYETYFVWFKPLIHLEHLRKRKGWLTNKIKVLPDWLIGYPLYPNHPKELIWISRFTYTFLDFIFLLGLFSGFYGTL